MLLFLQILNTKKFDIEKSNNSLEALFIAFASPFEVSGSNEKRNIRADTFCLSNSGFLCENNNF
jgi:hypothetical protein